MIPLNKGRSNAKNLARFTSLIALNIRIDSFYVTNFLFKFPAAVKTDLTALIP